MVEATEDYAYQQDTINKSCSHISEDLHVPINLLDQHNIRHEEDDDDNNNNERLEDEDEEDINFESEDEDGDEEDEEQNE
ncbi:hypothetical protein PIB30_092047 [Stylosanthes scabra]|uniref:Uncharacterized protein n=1 Tax=Stylosanthes scabra TaxID=79078 RepID=A0ABU6XSE6_9FABA|nr:hypothetical protein [Stylosanthes scabra]